MFTRIAVSTSVILCCHVSLECFWFIGRVLYRHVSEYKLAPEYRVLVLYVSSQQSGAPVVFFTHGGVWASGEPWQTVCMATRLAQAGCVVVCHTYTLFPEALVPQVSVSKMSWDLHEISCCWKDLADEHYCQIAILQAWFILSLLHGPSL